MYDDRNEPHEFVASQRDEAVAKACEFFGRERADLVIAEPAPGEVHGLAGRTLIVAVPKDRKPAAAPAGRGREGDRQERRGRGERERGRGRGRNGGEKRRGGRPGGTEAELSPEPATPSVGTARGELGKIGSFVLGVVERMGLGSFEIAESVDGSLIALELSGPAAQALASGDGRPVDALQLLASQAAARGEESRRVVLDVEGDADDREDRLTVLARRVARRARDSGRPVALDPMNGRDRRLIHLALRDEDGVATMSVGEGRYRQVLVVPEGAPEYEQAQREARAASQQE